MWTLVLSSAISFNWNSDSGEKESLWMLNKELVFVPLSGSNTCF